jgi:hypothetical protein
VKKKQWCLSIITIILMLSGCWSRKEPKNLSVTNSVVFDIRDGGIKLTLRNHEAVRQTGGKEGEKGGILSLSLKAKGNGSRSGQG